VIHLYAFVDGLRDLPLLDGAGGETLEARPLGFITAVVGRVDTALPATAATALAHGNVVEALGECAAAVLPARLGRPFADHAELVEATQPRLPALRERLLRVRGCVELGVRVAASERSEPDGDGDGAFYLRRRAAEQAAHAELRAELDAALRPHTVEHRADDGGAVRAAYLVRRADVAAFAREVDRFAERHPGLAVVCTGPWAPYSFVEEPT
jgi:hypothetical protein